MSSATTTTNATESKETKSVENCSICLAACTNTARTNCGHNFCLACIQRHVLIESRCPNCMQDITTLTPTTGAAITVARRRQQTQPIHELPRANVSSPSDDDQEGWPSLDSEFVPGIDNEGHSSPDVGSLSVSSRRPSASTRRGRPPTRRASASTSSSSSSSSIAPLILPQPTAALSARFNAVQTALQNVWEQLDVFVSGLRDKASFGELKADLPNIDDMDNFIASNNVACTTYISKCRSILSQIEKLGPRHRKLAQNLYIERAAESTVRERQRIQQEISQRQDRIAREQEELKELQASLGGRARQRRRLN